MEKHDTPRHDTAILGIFETFKTKNDTLTGTALRQRGILGALASSGSSEERTRTGISQHIAKGGSARWKNVYSGIFHDINDVLIPLGLVEEAGRIPPKRGPKVLQESGIPYYHLTREGRLVELAVRDNGKLGKQVSALFSGSGGEESKMGRSLALLAGFAPTLASSILAEYVKAYCDGQLKRLLPLTAEKLGVIKDDGVKAHVEFLVGALDLKETERERIMVLLHTITGDKH